MFLRRKLRVLFAFVDMLMVCLFQLRLVEMITPRYLASLVALMECPSGEANSKHLLIGQSSGGTQLHNNTLMMDALLVNYVGPSDNLT